MALRVMPHVTVILQVHALMTAGQSKSPFDSSICIVTSFCISLTVYKHVMVALQAAHLQGYFRDLVHPGNHERCVHICTCLLQFSVSKPFLGTACL